MRERERKRGGVNECAEHEASRNRVVRALHSLCIAPPSFHTVPVRPCVPGSAAPAKYTACLMHRVALRPPQCACPPNRSFCTVGASHPPSYPSSFLLAPHTPMDTPPSSAKSQGYVPPPGGFILRYLPQPARLIIISLSLTTYMLLSISFSTATHHASSSYFLINLLLPRPRPHPFPLSSVATNQTSPDSSDSVAAGPPLPLSVQRAPRYSSHILFFFSSQLVAGSVLCECPLENRLKTPTSTR